MLLQAGLRILERIGFRHVRHALGKQVENHPLSLSQAAVQVDRSKQRLEGIGQNGFAAESAPS